MRLVLVKTLAAHAVVIVLAVAAAASAQARAPVVFANRETSAGATSPATLRPVSYQPADASPATLADAPTGEPDLLYGYGRSRKPAQPVIDLRSGASRAGVVRASADAASLNEDAFSAAPEAEPPPPRTEFRAAAPRAGAVSPPVVQPLAPAPADVPSARPAWLEQERTGAPYEAKGQWYVPTAEPGYSENGAASWYGDEFRGRRTSNGETYDPEALSAAHPTLPVNSLVQVTNLANGREVIVRINDRGPFHPNRLIDVSRKAAEVLGFADTGEAQVNVRYLGPAPKRVATGAPAVASLPVAQAAPVAPRVQTAVHTAHKGAYVVQAGAFSNSQNAARAREQLSTLGEVAVDVRGSLQRVRVGSWETKAEADAARQGAVRMGFTGAVVALAD